MSSEPRPEARRPEPDEQQRYGPLSPREQWALARAVYPLNPGIPHTVDFPAVGPGG